MDKVRLWLYRIHLVSDTVFLYFIQKVYRTDYLMACEQGCPCLQ